MIIKTDLTGEKRKFLIGTEAITEYEESLSKHSGEYCIVGLFDGNTYEVTFNDGSQYDIFPGELFK
jgi:hypothetical protein